MNERVMVVQHASGWCVLLHGFLQADGLDEAGAVAQGMALKAEREACGAAPSLVVRRRPTYNA